MRKAEINSLNIPEYHKRLLEDYVKKAREGKRLQNFKIVLFGSCAREKTTPHSDVDLCIVADFEEAERDDLEFFFKHEVIRHSPDDILLFTNAEMERNKDNLVSVIRYIWKDGVVIHE